MAPFFSRDIRAVISRVEEQISSVENEIVVLRDEQYHRENCLDELLSQPNSEEKIALILQQNDITINQIITMQGNIAQMRRRTNELAHLLNVADVREKHQRLLFGSFLV